MKTKIPVELGENIRGISLDAYGMCNLTYMDDEGVPQVHNIRIPEGAIGRERATEILEVIFREVK